ncbi:unnamed protein product [Acanthoscelides obtectus]|uniref:BESS domain-containing protein n=1 Tax=Acanthoscelides obtectus TaxID=200917 RepID=A0A9P0MCF5_ACAOB|nr:unnamed protein product [Acanthoscelides obtectus]CAK1641004.1 hypothetical protein AOBTE_LOCUS12071 [Acanthoscelides obtectus]
MQENIQDDTQNNGQEVTQDEIQEDIQHSFDDTHKNMQENTQRQMQKKDNAEQHRPKNIQTPKPKKSRHDSTLELVNKREDERSLVYKKKLEKHSPLQPSAIRKFFDSMADVVETFQLRDQADIRLKICQLVTEREIQLTQQTPYVAAPVSSDNSSAMTVSTHYVATPMTSDESNTPQTLYVSTPMPSTDDSNFTWL